MTKRKIEYWVITPQQDGEFVACMEEVLEPTQSVRSQQPVLCMDEQTVQFNQGDAGADSANGRAW